MLHLPQIRSYGLILVPNYQACKYNYIRSSSIILLLHLTSSHVFISCILSACMSVTVSASQHPCMLHLHPTICHVCNNCIRPLAMSLTVTPNQKSYLLHQTTRLVPTSSQDGNEHLLHADSCTLLRVAFVLKQCTPQVHFSCFFFFCKYPSIQLIFPA